MLCILALCLLSILLMYVGDPFRSVVLSFPTLTVKRPLYIKKDDQTLLHFTIMNINRTTNTPNTTPPPFFFKEKDILLYNKKP